MLTLNTTAKSAKKKYKYLKLKTKTRTRRWISSFFNLGNLAHFRHLYFTLRLWGEE